jgi:preprotein translocase subunit SecG
VSPKIDLQKNRKDLIDRTTACIALIWLGMVLGISFLEAPVKFMAPSVTREIGLDIGRYVFGVFNKVECVFALIIAILLIITRRKDLSMVPLGLAWLSLALQTAWLLPVLAARTEVIIQGHTPAPSVSHTIYVVLELMKAVSLAVYGIWKVLKGKT